MKKYSMLLLFVSLIHLAQAQDVQFFPGTWEEARSKAKSENKYIMVDAFTDWCGPCKRMDREMFHGNAQVAEFINANFISFKADCEKTPGAAIAIKFKVMSYPTLLFFNPQGELVSRSLGYTADQKVFMEPFQKALAIKDKKVYAYDSKALDPGFPAIYKQSFKVDGVNAKRSSPDEVIQYLDAQSDKFSEANWNLMYVYSFPGKYEQFLTDNFDKYHSLYKSEASDAMVRIASKHVGIAMKSKDEKELAVATAIIKKYAPDQADELLPAWQINFYRSTEQWKKYAEAVNMEIAKDPGVDVDYLNQFCWAIYENTDDPELTKTALGWLDSRTDKLRSYEVLDTYASLLFKGGRLEEAEAYALKAIKAGEDDDHDVASTKDLLTKIRAAKSSSNSSESK